MRTGLEKKKPRSRPMTTVAGFVFVHDLVRITDDSAHHLSVRMTATPLSLLPLKNKKLSD